MLSTDDYGKDLASVQTLQRKHEGIDRDLGALQEKVIPNSKDCYEFICHVFL